MIEFKVNNYITLRLEENRTIIYVDDKPFMQCKSLLLNIPIEEMSSFDEIESIDEAAEKLDRSFERNRVDIPPEVEFWGHCSNIQVWYEYNYDTRLLHSNLAFPLLERLTEAGDSLAKKVFKEEVLKRLEKGGDTVILFLLEKSYLVYFTKEELTSIYESNIAKFESSKLLLPFLRALHVSPAINHYRELVKRLILTENFTEKKKILEDHSDILSEEDLICLLNELKAIEVEEDEKDMKFSVLNTIMSELLFEYEANFNLSDIVRTLLYEEEQKDLLDIFNASEYPYEKLDFQADSVRRRFWQKRLYYEFHEGHVMDIELLCDNENFPNFYKNLEKLKSFKRLRCINLLFFCEYDFDLVKDTLLSTAADKIKLYEFFEDSPVPQMKILKYIV